MIDGGAAGFLGSVINRYVPQARGFGQPIAAMGVGMFRNNTTLKVEGSRELGAALGAMLLGGGNGAAGGGASGGGAY